MVARSGLPVTGWQRASFEQGMPLCAAIIWLSSYDQAYIDFCGACQFTGSGQVCAERASLMHQSC